MKFDVSVVVPTYLEPGIGSLIHDIDQVCTIAGLVTEIIVVDDSPDTSVEEAVNETPTTAETYVFHRPAGDNAWGGLSGAVIDGICASGSDIVVVMDGDGQHPASVIPIMVRTLQNSNHSIDTVVASRYTDTGTANGLDGGWRHTVSKASTVLARSMFPKRVGAKTSDPMTGFFAVRPAAIDIDRAAGYAEGFKILLAILATNPQLRVAEVPFVFGGREDGESKASTANGLLFLKQVAKMRMTA